MSKSSSGFGTLGTGVSGVVGVAGSLSNGCLGADTGSLSFLPLGW